VDRLSAGFLKKAVSRLCSQATQDWLRTVYVSRGVLRSAAADEPELAALPRIVSARATVLDIGANAGVYTLHLARGVGAGGKVYAFEPLTANFRILSRVCKHAGLENVECIHAAVAEECGEAEIVLPEDIPGYEKYYQSRLATETDQCRGEKVQVFSLDEFCLQYAISSIGFIKCDVEGAEARVLRGARNVITRFRPTWLLEVSKPNAEEVFSALLAAGYEAFRYHQHFERTRYNGRFCNYFFIPTEYCQKVLG
jgi:FkbM family methyltransferase